MENVTNAYEIIAVQKNVDYSVRFIIENNFLAVQKKLAEYGIAVNNTLEAYASVISLIGTNAFKDVLSVPYLKDATNGTGGLNLENYFQGSTITTAPDGAQQRLFNGGFSTFISNITDGDLISALTGGISNVISSVGGVYSGVIGSTLGGASTLTGTALGGVGTITAPLLGGISPTQQNQVPLNRTDAESSNKTGVVIFVVVALLLISGAIYFVTKKKK